MFCDLGLIWCSTEGVESHFRVLRSLTHFRRYRGRRVLFSCFAFLNLFWAEPRAPGPVFMFCAPGRIWGGTEGVGPVFISALSDSFSILPRVSGPVFMYCTFGFVLGGIYGVVFYFHVLRSRTCSRRYSRRRVEFSCFALPDLFFRGRRVPFSYFVLRDSFCSVPRASGEVFMFCASGLVFDDTEGVR
jgi:hypothetical protein